MPRCGAVSFTAMIFKHYKGSHLFLITKQKAKKFCIFFTPIYISVRGWWCSWVAGIVATQAGTGAAPQPRPDRAHPQGVTMRRASDVCRFAKPRTFVGSWPTSWKFVATFADSRSFAQIRGVLCNFVAFCATSWIRRPTGRMR